jgi:hypothetical protein
VKVKLVDIHIQAVIPETKPALGHHAVVAVDEAVKTVVTKLEELGLKPTHSVDILTKRPRSAAEPAAV